MDIHPCHILLFLNSEFVAISDQLRKRANLHVRSMTDLSDNRSYIVACFSFGSVISTIIIPYPFHLLFLRFIRIVPKTACMEVLVPQWFCSQTVSRALMPRCLKSPEIRHFFGSQSFTRDINTTVSTSFSLSNTLPPASAS